MKKFIGTLLIASFLCFSFELLAEPFTPSSEPNNSSSNTNTNGDLADTLFNVGIATLLVLGSAYGGIRFYQIRKENREAAREEAREEELWS